MKNILIIAGEASSDRYAANLIKDMRSIQKDIVFRGLGGDEMEAAGAQLFDKITHLAFIGPGGLLRGYLKLRNVLGCLIRQIKKQRPDYAILLDYAEFNLRVARVLKNMGVPVIYYISPQIWAWGLWRVNTIRRLVDKIIVFFQFEETLYRKYSIDVKCVGHPLLEIVKVTADAKEFKKNLGIQENSKVIGILPGSRKSEIKNILPIMLESALTLANTSKTDINFILPLAPTIDVSAIKDLMSGLGIKVLIVHDNIYNALNICDCAMVASGTATLETALIGIPMAIIYKTNFLTYILTKKLIKLPFIGLVNIVAGKKIVEEFLQYDARPEKISSYLQRIISNKELSCGIKQEFIKVKKSLGTPGAGMRAAGEIIRFINNNPA
ncbi:MAG: lipid-A-disaccharide synthase [Candidatus Omnitrophica bacterium]|jgi:lipid-A-disaccharide synthase|nr:lipid-A-disaccharide synthase [Candidatus Omnitrophota bacterium]